MPRWFPSFLHFSCLFPAQDDRKTESNSTKSNSNPVFQRISSEFVPYICTVTDIDRGKSYEFYEFPLFEEIFTVKMMGKESGCVNFVYPSGSRYVGRVKDGLRHGFGVMKWGEQAEYIGNWELGVPKNEGKMTYKGYNFQGIWSDSSISGSVDVLTVELDGLQAWLQAFNEGYCKTYTVWLWYVHHKRPGNASFQGTDQQVLVQKAKIIHELLLQAEKAMQKSTTCRFTKNDDYFGCMSDGKAHGLGRRRFAGDCYCEGEWRNGQIHGVGVYQWGPSRRKVGVFSDGRLIDTPILIENERNEDS